MPRTRSEYEQRSALRRELRLAAENALRTLEAARTEEALADARRQEALARSRGPRPQPSLIRSCGDAEEAAAAWMRWLGWGDATTTPAGTDASIEVVARHAVARVAANVALTGRPEVQQLFGVGASLHRTPVFFSSSGYTVQATQWSDSVEMPLFTFDLSGEPQPVNRRARSIWTHGAFGGDHHVIAFDDEVQKVADRLDEVVSLLLRHSYEPVA